MSRPSRSTTARGSSKKTGAKYAFDERKSPEIAAFVRSFGQLVRRFRRGAGLTQDQLAENSGVDRSHISDIERGVNAPSLVVLFKLAKGMGIDPADLLCIHDR